MTRETIRTQLRVIHTDGSAVLVDAVASCKVGNYVFLIHVDTSDTTRFNATYAPCARHGGSGSSIAETIADLCRHDELRMRNAIDRELARMAVEHVMEYAPETGIQTCDWQWREEYRFKSGEYLPVPSVDGKQYPCEHYLHLSVTKTESDFIAYTPSVQYGEQDRQVRMKFGKYLRKTFPGMTDAEVQHAVTAFKAKLALAESPAHLLFATDRETINQIFETPMYARDSTVVSCMYKKFDGDEIRPYHVYADSPDVAVAYVVERGEIIARSVVSTKDKEWIRPYSVDTGDATKCEILTGMLWQAGYNAGDLYGSRLTKLDTRNVMLPYLDHGGIGVRDAGKYWTCCDENEGDYNADCTDGTASEMEPRCERCNNNEDECACIYCECCEESYYHGCDSCSMCPECDGCREHDHCDCDRCSECSEIINPSSRYTDGCACARCEECGELTDNCDCETETETEEAQTEEAAI